MTDTDPSRIYFLRTRRQWVKVIDQVSAEALAQRLWSGQGRSKRRMEPERSSESADRSKKKPLKQVMAVVGVKAPETSDKPG